MKYQIVSRWDHSRILYEAEGDSLKAVVETAVKADADLGGADLGGADLRCADLRYANLGGANLGGADLRYATLCYADLRCADVGGANLGGANLGGADSGDVKTAMVQWTGLGAESRMWTAVHEPARLVSDTRGAADAKTTYYCGCFSGTEAELHARIDEGDAKFRASRLRALAFLSESIALALEGRDA